MLERYGHGGDVWTAAESYGISKDAFLDFSSNMNPLGPPPSVERIFAEEWRKGIVRYPDPASRELRQRISEVYRIPVECILAGNGAAELIDLAVRVLQPKVTGLVRPSFSEYEEAVRKYGGDIRDIQLSPENGFLPDCQTLDRHLDACSLLFLGHPNNPTGRLLDTDLIRYLMDRDKPLILDEAFIDFAENEEEVTFIREAASSDRLFVIRSMTKFYAIPGIRLGFVVARPDWIEAMGRLQVQWSVNFLAQRIGTEVLGDSRFASETKHWLREERAWLVSRLASIGCQTVPSDTNFLLFRLPKEAPFTIKDLQTAMGRKGVLIRDASLFPGLDSSYGRVAVRLRAENARLADTMKAAMEELG